MYSSDGIASLQQRVPQALRMFICPFAPPPKKNSLKFLVYIFFLFVCLVVAVVDSVTARNFMSANYFKRDIIDGHAHVLTFNKGLHVMLMRLVEVATENKTRLDGVHIHPIESADPIVVKSIPSFVRTLKQVLAPSLAIVVPTPAMTILAPPIPQFLGPTTRILPPPPSHLAQFVVPPPLPTRSKSRLIGTSTNWLTLAPKNDRDLFFSVGLAQLSDIANIQLISQTENVPLESLLGNANPLQEIKNMRIELTEFERQAVATNWTKWRSVADIGNYLRYIEPGQRNDCSNNDALSLIRFARWSGIHAFETRFAGRQLSEFRAPGALQNELERAFEDTTPEITKQVSALLDAFWEDPFLVRQAYGRRPSPLYGNVALFVNDYKFAFQVLSALVGAGARAGAAVAGAVPPISRVSEATVDPWLQLDRSLADIDEREIGAGKWRPQDRPMLQSRRMAVVTAARVQYDNFFKH